MSAQVAPRQSQQSPRASLREVPKPAERVATVPFVLVVVVLLAFGMVGMVVLTTALQDQAFAVQESQHEANILASQVSQLETEVADARSVKSLAIAASKLGMRPNPYAVPLRLSDGKVMGTARSVYGNELPGVKYLTAEQAQAQVTALDNAAKARTAKAAAARAQKTADAATKNAAAAAKAGAQQKAEAAKQKGARG